jgi:hypothetical protein
VSARVGVRRSTGYDGTGAPRPADAGDLTYVADWILREHGDDWRARDMAARLKRRAAMLAVTEKRRAAHPTPEAPDGR